MFSNGLGQQVRGNGSGHKGDEGETKGMSQECPVATLAPREGRKKLHNAMAKIDWQAKNGAQLNDYGIHLPVATGQAYVQQRLGNSQVCSRADWQELSKAFDNSQQ
jgi:hypothetical protein